MFLKILSPVFLFCASLTGLALAIALNSRDQYQELSIGMYGEHAPLMNSTLFDFMMNWPFSIVVALLTLAGLVKEFLVKDVKAKLKVNVSLFILLGVWFSFLIYLPLSI